MELSGLMRYARSRRRYDPVMRDYREQMRTRMEALEPERPAFRFSVDLPGASDPQRGDIPAWQAASGEPGGRVRQRRSDRPAVTRRTLGATPAVSRRGMTVKMASVILGILIVMLALVWLGQITSANTARKQITAEENSIADLKTEIDLLQQQLLESRSETSIGYEAVHMGLISSKGVSAVYLSVPADANVLLADSGAVGR